jgi:cyclase
MVAKRIIPCLDVKDGRVVKGINFLNLVDAGSPIEQACSYSQENADELVFLDITASIEKRSAMIEVINKTAEKVFIPFTVGGGVRNINDIRALLHSGADKVSVNTAALTNPELITQGSQEFGSQCIVVAIDAKLKKNQPNKQWEVYTYGGKQPTGVDAIHWAKKAQSYGAGEILLTSMDRDGTTDGYDLDLTRAVSRAVNIPVIASGGAGNPEDIYRVLTEGEADAALAASIFHYGKYSIAQTKKYLKDKGVLVRG